LFALRCNFKITEVSHVLGYFIPELSFCIYFDKNGFGYILGDFSLTHLVTLALTQR
jgi:hypothetical protein